MATQDEQTMCVTISASLQRLHQLAWQPGQWMDSDWWQTLSLQPWQESYQRHPVLRPALDALIVSRRGFPLQALPASLTPFQEQLLALESRLPRLCMALGLLALSCPDYLLMGDYRRQLSSVLGTHGCDLLLALGGFPDQQSPTLVPEELAASALARGVAWLRHSAGDCVACQTLVITLPPEPELAVPELGPAFPWLLRIGRFL